MAGINDLRVDKQPEMTGSKVARRVGTLWLRFPNGSDSAMFQAKLTKHHTRAILVDQSALNEILDILADFQKQSRAALILHHNTSEPALRQMEESGVDQALPIDEQYKFRDIVREAKQMARLEAKVQLVDDVEIRRVDVTDIPKLSGVGPKAIKALTIDAGGAKVSLHLKLDQESLNVFWMLEGTVEAVERANARIQQFVAQATRPWWMLHTWWVGAILLFLPFVFAVVTLVIFACVSLLNGSGHTIGDAFGAAYATLQPYATSFNIIWWIWIVAGWFFQTRVWRFWTRLFPKVDFRLGRNVEPSIGLGKIRIGILSTLFAVFVAPYIGPLLGSLLRR